MGYNYYCDYWPSVSGGRGLGSGIPYLGPIPIMDGGLTWSNGGTGFESIASSDSGSHTAMKVVGTNVYETTDGSGFQFGCAGGVSTCSGSIVINRAGDSFSQPFGSSALWAVADRNGNQMTSPGTDFGPDEFWPLNKAYNPTSWTMTDTVGRLWSYSKSSNTSGCPSSVGSDNAYIWTTPGPNGGTRTFEFCFSQVSFSTNLPDPHTTGHQTYQYVGSADFLSAIVLPDGTNWQFQALLLAIILITNLVIYGIIGLVLCFLWTLLMRRGPEES